MYNEERKKEFVEQYTNSLTNTETCYYLFRKLEPIETERGKDICSFDETELFEVLDNFFGIRKGSQEQRIGILRKYAEWCIKSSVPGATDALLKLEVAGVEKMRLCTVANPLQFQDYLNEIFPPEELKTVANVYRCYLWLAYMGVEQSEAIGLKRSDVHFETMSVVCNDRDFPIYRESLNAFRNTVFLEEFERYHPNYNGTALMKRPDGEELLRGERSVMTIGKLRSQIGKYRLNKDGTLKTHRWLSYDHAALSGKFYRIWMQEVAGRPINFRDLTMLSKQKSDFAESDYNTWKKAFNI